MRKVIMSVFTMLSCYASQAQFDQVARLAILDTLNIKTIEWMDADNDSLLDVLITAKTPDSTYSFLFLKNNDGTLFSYASTTKTNFTQLTYLADDYDFDNQMDIILSGTTLNNPLTSVLINNGNFEFAILPSPLLSSQAALIKFIDLDLDGDKELILSGGDLGAQVNIYKHASSDWTLMTDSLMINASEFLTADFNGDMFKDILICGKNSNNQFVATVLFNKGDFYFTDPYSIENFAEAVLVTTDTNYDGIPDIFITGKTSTDALVSKQMIGTNSQTFIELDSLIDVHVKSFFAADMNSDGQIDFNMLGLNQLLQPANIIKFSPETSLNLPSEAVHQQKFGDADRDGDLDLLQLRSDSLILLKNNTVVENQSPGEIISPVAFFVFDRLFAYWEKPGDDHTPQNSITYDLTINSQSGETLMGDFDLINKKRTIVTQGNNGFQNFTLLKNFNQSPFELSVQAIDNAYHAASYGVCRGNGQPCNELATEIIQICGSEKPPLTAGQNAMWFSFKDGFLGTFDTYPYSNAVTDTLFAFVPESKPTCASLKLFLIEHVDEAVKVDSVSRYACKGEDIIFTVENDWAEITWTTLNEGIVSHEPTFNYTASEDDVITGEVSDGNGCSIRHVTSILISEPVINNDTDVYQVLKGESVQLAIMGGVAYTWEPSTGLSNPTSGTTTANPLATTEYKVTITDSIGCSTVDKILILVEETAFIPNLFTPNDDGKNDALKIYGVNQINNFSFSVFNREGSLVFNTSNVHEAAADGWNGQVRGIDQPSGVYHWKVSGEYSNGQSLLLNGKKTGSIILMR